MTQSYNLVFSDGTGQRGVRDEKGNAGAGATNIYKMYLAARSVPAQTCFYDAGLGSDPEKPLDWVTWGKNLVAKATGLGITRNIWECYEFLLLNDSGDRRIGLFGFSRGAYTVRSLGGLLSLCGIPAATQNGVDIRGSSKAEKALRGAIINEAIKIYQTAYGEAGKPERERLAGLFRAKYSSREAAPHVIGVFDTVAALGLPGVADMFNPLKHHFHDARLSTKVPFGFQALSIDENRATFSPDIWDQRFFVPGQTIEQVWFPGVHSDIGGGYAESRLSDVTLGWMQMKCAHPGVGIALPFSVPPAPDINGVQHDERTGLGVFWWPADRGVKIRKDAVDVDPLADKIERRFDAAANAYRPPALAGHPRVAQYY